MYIRLTLMQNILRIVFFVIFLFVNEYIVIFFAIFVTEYSKTIKKQIARGLHILTYLGVFTPPPPQSTGNTQEARAPSKH